MNPLMLREGIRNTVAQRAGRDLSAGQFSVKAKLTTKAGLGFAKEMIAGGILSPEISTVRDFIMLLGMKTLHVVEHGHSQDSPVSAFVCTQDLLERVPGDEVELGDGVITFYPIDYARRISADRVASVIEHEFWHIFLGKQFPEYQIEMDEMQAVTGKPVPYFKAHFINPFSHFFLRIAALEAQRTDFVISDATDEFQTRTRGIELAKQSAARAGETFGRMTATTLYAGLLFSHVFPFELFPAFENRAQTNLDAIKALMTGVLDPALLAEADDLARSILSESLVSSGDVKMRSFCDPIIRAFQAFYLQGIA